MNQKLEVGQTAPDLTLQSINGGLTQVAGKNLKKAQLLFFVSPDCPVCKNLLPAVKSAAVHESDWLDLVFASDGQKQDHDGLVKSHGLAEFPYLISELLGKTYGISKLPYGVLIDKQGVIRSMGIINSREHLDSLFEAKEHKVASIQDYMNKGVQLAGGDK